MRWVICALALFAFVPRALADDLDLLRGALPVGPATFTKWSGFYIGGQAGYSDASAAFGGATQAPVAYALRETTLETENSPSTWPVLGDASRHGVNYGGFLGYNTQWQDLILGIEANYTQSSLTIGASNTPIGRITPSDSQGNTYLVNITGSGSVSNLDFGSVRVRAGWIVGNFLPYGFFGLAAGSADVSVTANVSGEENPPATGACLATNTKPCSTFSFTGTAGKSPQTLVGVSVGGGLDVALTPNIFVRGEYEYDQFSPVSGILVNVSTVRAGAGIKF